METKQLRGDVLAKPVREEIRVSVSELRSRGIVPRLAAVLVGSDPEVLSYAESKARLASDLGIVFDLVALPADESQKTVEETLSQLSANQTTHGIILEMPLPAALDVDAALVCISPKKDVDGMTLANLDLLREDREGEALLPATPQACLMLAEFALKEAGKSLTEVKVGVVGRGRTVGGPLIAMLSNRKANVIVCHSETEDLAEELKDCDLVFSAVGEPGLLNRKNLREGQILIDAGLSIVNGASVGDVDAESVLGFAAAMTPVPQGVGPLTTTLIFKNLLRAIRLQK